MAKSNNYDEIYEALKKLFNDGYIYYGSLIPKEVLEKALNIELGLSEDNHKYWTSQGKLICLIKIMDHNEYPTIKNTIDNSISIVNLLDGDEAYELCQKYLKKIKKFKSLIQQRQIEDRYHG